MKIHGLRLVSGVKINMHSTKSHTTEVCGHDTPCFIEVAISHNEVAGLCRPFPGALYMHKLSLVYVCSCLVCLYLSTSLLTHL